jgi:hypothetical protein
MALPGVSFKEFVKNPLAAFMFISLIAIGYLYFDNRSTLTSQIDDLKSDVTELKKDNKELNNKIIEMAQKIND